VAPVANPEGAAAGGVATRGTAASGTVVDGAPHSPPANGEAGATGKAKPLAPAVASAHGDRFFHRLPFISVAKASAAIAAVLGLLWTVNEAYWASDRGRERTVAAAILDSHTPPPTADEMDVYVPRPELEDALEAFLRAPRCEGDGYMVLVGPRGTGKSILLSHVLSKMGGGVVLTRVGGPAATESGDLDLLVVGTALKQYAQPGWALSSSSPAAMEGRHLRERLVSAARVYHGKHSADEDWRPTVVLDVSHSSDGALIRSACTRLKELTYDEQRCHGVIVLSSSYAVADLPPDPSRQTFLLVGSFSPAEASAKLERSFATMPNGLASCAAVAAVEQRVLPLTTLASDLVQLAKSVRGSTEEKDLLERAEAWARQFEAKARKDVEGALTLEHIMRNGRKLPVADLMREMLAAGGPIKLPTAKNNVEAANFAAHICSTPGRPSTWTSLTRRSASPVARIALRRRRCWPRADGGSLGSDACW
jgi:hypothetical protein